MGPVIEQEMQQSSQLGLRRALVLSLVAVLVSLGVEDPLGRVWPMTALPADASVTPGSNPGFGTARPLDDRSVGRGGARADFDPPGPAVVSSGRYGSLDVSVLSARAVPVNTTGLPIIVIEAAFRNRGDLTYRIPTSMVRIRAADDRTVPIHRFDHTERYRRISVPPGATATATLVVRLPADWSADPASYQLEFGELGRWPLLLALTGAGDQEPPAVDEERQPPGSVVGPLTVDASPADQSAEPGPTVTAAWSDLNYRAYRARIGQKMVVVVLAVGPAREFNRLAKPAGWALESATGVDQRYEALTVEHQPRSESTPRLRLVFEVPLQEGGFRLIETASERPLALLADE